MFSINLFVTLQRRMKTILRSVGQFVHQLDGPISGDSILTINTNDLWKISSALLSP